MLWILSLIAVGQKVAVKLAAMAAGGVYLMKSTVLLTAGHLRFPTGNP